MYQSSAQNDRQRGEAGVTSANVNCANLERSQIDLDISTDTRSNNGYEFLKRGLKTGVENNLESGFRKPGGSTLMKKSEGHLSPTLVDEPL